MWQRICVLFPPLIVAAVSNQALDSGVSETYFYQISSNVSINPGTGEYTKTLYVATKVQCAQACSQQGDFCAGFEWDPKKEEKSGMYKCVTAQFITVDRIV